MTSILSRADYSAPFRGFERLVGSMGRYVIGQFVNKDLEFLWLRDCAGMLKNRVVQDDSTGDGAGEFVGPVSVGQPRSSGLTP